ncbi:MAG TPA: lipid-binding protein [Paludibacteraceae bacterium]|nr:lipid-binding protein [Paludibacteraceae bacterium]HPQ12800.1 lipid-binding protein [Paludibacteraceae bacterium]HQG67919.1 lipid-binding protein [Paludibacteraceae bacterium]
MRINKFFILSILSLALFSCEPKYEKEYNWAYPVCGDWMVKAYLDGTEIYGPFEIMTYNTSFGQDSIWIHDYATTATNGHFWSFKVKAAVDMKTLTFQTEGSINAIAGYPIVIKVSNGRVINKDSITMELEFEDDPGTIYQLAGHRETSYEEYMEQ